MVGGHNITFVSCRFANIVRPIVLVAPDLPERVWAKISFFPELYYVNGTALEVVSLRRAGVTFASKAVLLAKPHSTYVVARMRCLCAFVASSDSVVVVRRPEIEATSLAAHVDAGTIFAHRAVTKENPAVDTFTEILLHDNIPFVNPSMQQGPLEEEHQRSFFLYPHFAAGRVYTASIIGT